MVQYVLAMDQGTTSSRSVLFGHDGNIVSHNLVWYTHCAKVVGDLWQVLMPPLSCAERRFPDPARCVNEHVGGMSGPVEIGSPMLRRLAECVYQCT